MKDCTEARLIDILIHNTQCAIYLNRPCELICHWLFLPFLSKITESSFHIHPAKFLYVLLIFGPLVVASECQVGDHSFVGHVLLYFCTSDKSYIWYSIFHLLFDLFCIIYSLFSKLHSAFCIFCFPLSILKSVFFIPFFCSLRYKDDPRSIWWFGSYITNYRKYVFYND